MNKNLGILWLDMSVIECRGTDLCCYNTRRSQHSRECKDPRRQCFCDSWTWPL